MASRSIYPYNPYRANTSVGIPYQSMYDPSFDQNIAQLMVSENQKAMQAIAGLQAQEAAVGDLFSLMPEERNQQLENFKQRTNAVKEKFNNDLALAAPALAQEIVKERANPWYQKNALYTQEYQRKQKLMDQYGPNIITTKDLPGSIADANMEDIQFEYLNRQHLYQQWDENFGALAKRVKDLGLSEADYGMLKQAVQQGIPVEQIPGVVETFEPLLDSIINEQGLQDSPEVRSKLLNEFTIWATNNLVGGEQARYMQPPKSTGSGLGFGFVPLEPRSFTVGETEVAGEENVKKAKAAHTLEPLSPDDESLPQNVREYLSGEEYQEALTREPKFVQDSPLIKDLFIGYDNLSEETKAAITQELNGSLRTLLNPLNKNNIFTSAFGRNDAAKALLSKIQGTYDVEINGPLGPFKGGEAVNQLSRQLENYANWVQTDYLPKERKAQSKAENTQDTTGVIQAESSQLLPLKNTVGSWMNSGMLERATYYDETMSPVSGPKKGHKNIKKLMEEKGFNLVDAHVIRGTERTPNVLKLTLENKEGKKEEVRVAPNSADSQAFVEEISSIFRSPDILHAAASQTYYDIMKANDGKLSFSDLLPEFENVEFKQHIERKNINGKKQYVLVNNETGKVIDGTETDDLSNLIEDWAYSIPEVWRQFIPYSVDYRFYRNVAAEESTPKQERETALGNLQWMLMQTQAE